MWTTTYLYKVDLDGGDAGVWSSVRDALVEAVPFDAGSPQGRAFDEECRRRIRESLPEASGGYVLSLPRLFVVAKRPALFDIYQEYADYYQVCVARSNPICVAPFSRPRACASLLTAPARQGLEELRCHAEPASPDRVAVGDAGGQQ